MRYGLLSFIVLSNVLYSLCVPIPLDLDYSETSDYAPGETTKTYHDDSPEVKRIKEGHALANLHIDAMHTIVHDHEKPEHKAILNEHFGESHNIDAIKRRVAMLKTGKVKISKINDHKNQPRDDAVPIAKFGKGGVSFAPGAHSAQRTAQDTAGTIIHEASHALWKSKDYYLRLNTGLRPVSYKQVKKFLGMKSVTKKNFVLGYYHAKQLDILKNDHKKMASRMHKNADSWKGFGAAAHAHVEKTKAQAQASESGSAPKRHHPDPDSGDDGPSSPKKQKKSSDKLSKAAQGSSTGESSSSNQRGSTSTASGSSSQQKSAPSTDRSLKKTYTPGTTEPGSSVHHNLSKTSLSTARNSSPESARSKQFTPAIKSPKVSAKSPEPLKLPRQQRRPPKSTASKQKQLSRLSTSSKAKAHSSPKPIGIKRFAPPLAAAKVQIKGRKGRR